MSERTLCVPTQKTAQRLDVILAQMLPEFSRSKIQSWLKSGNITLNKRTCLAKEQVYGGELLLIDVQSETNESAAQAESIPLDIIFEDEHLLVINKPAGLIVHPGAGNPNHTLVNALLFHDPMLAQLPRAGLIHRLDKDTTGLLIIAKSLVAHTQLIRQMQSREIHRSYLALVSGSMYGSGTVDTFYGRHPRQRLKMAVCKHGKQAITHFITQQNYLGSTLLRVKLETGRTHQIRVHMAHLGHPIIGDQLYNSLQKNINQHSLKSFSRQALHAYSLEFEHPITRDLLALSAPLPRDFLDLLETLDARVVS